MPSLKEFIVLMEWESTVKRLVHRLVIAILALSFILTAFAAQAAKKIKKQAPVAAAGKTSGVLPVSVIFLDEVRRDENGQMSTDLEALMTTIASVKGAARAQVVTDESYVGSLNKNNSVPVSVKNAIHNSRACDINVRGAVCVVLEKSYQNGKIIVEAYNLVMAESARIKGYDEVARKPITSKQVTGLAKRLGRMTKDLSEGIYIYSSVPTEGFLKALAEEQRVAEKENETSRTVILGNEVIDITDLKSNDERSTILRQFIDGNDNKINSSKLYDINDPNLPRGSGVLHIIKQVGSDSNDMNNYKVQVVTDPAVISSFDVNYTKQVQSNAQFSGKAGEQYANASGPALFNSCYVTSELQLKKTNEFWKPWKILDFLFQKRDENGQLVEAQKTGKGFLDCILKDGTRQHVKIVLKDFAERIGFIHSNTTEKIFSFGVGYANGALDILLLRKFAYFNFIPTAQVLVTGLLVNPIIIREDITKKPVFAFAAAITLPPNIDRGDSPLMLNAYLSFVGKYEITIDPDDT